MELASEVLLCEKQKFQQQNVASSDGWTEDLRGFSLMFFSSQFSIVCKSENLRFMLY